MQYYAIVVNDRTNLWWLSDPTEVYRVIQDYGAFSYAVIGGTSIEAMPGHIRALHSLAPLDRILIVARCRRIREIRNEGKESEEIVYDPPVNLYVWTGRAKDKERILPHYYAQAGWMRRVPTEPATWAPYGPQAPLKRSLRPAPTTEPDLVVPDTAEQKQARRDAAIAYGQTLLEARRAYRSAKATLPT